MAVIAFVLLIGLGTGWFGRELARVAARFHADYREGKRKRGIR